MSRPRRLASSVLLTAGLLVPACSTDADTAESPSGAPAVSGRTTEWWHPGRGLTWQWQLDDEPIAPTIDAQVEFCRLAQRLGMSSIRKKLELDAWRDAC